MARKQKRLTKKELRQDPLVKTMTETQLWLEKNGKALLIGVFAGVVIFFGINLFRNMQASNEGDAAMAYFEAAALLASNQEEVAIASLDSVAQSYRGQTGGHNALLELAELHLRNGDAELAYESFLQLRNRAGRDRLLKITAMDGMAASLEDLERFDEAAAIYDEIVRYDRNGFAIPLALYKAGRCYSLAGNAGMARQRFERILDEYDGSIVNRDAEREIALLDLAG